jgi:iron complex transport system substrate-binding protein
MKSRFNQHICWLLASSLVLSSCAIAAPPALAPSSTQPARILAPAAAAPSTNLADGCVQNFNPEVDYFPEKVTVADAVGFKVDYFKNYKVVTVLNPWLGAQEQFQYVLVQCGTPRPSGFDKAPTIEVPAKSVIAMSTTELPALEQIGALDKLVALDSLLYVNNSTVSKMIEAGKLKEIGSGAQVNVEQVVALKPDIVFTSGSASPEYNAHPKLLEAGIDVALDGSYVERSPLGRAEWNKFIALFFNREAAATKAHDEVRSAYNMLADKARAAQTKPIVFNNLPYQDDWFVPGGDSYVARLLSDAGASYIWADEKSVDSIPLKMEQVLDKAGKADVWLINAFGVYTDTSALLATDPRFGEFDALKNKNVWNYDRRVNANGGNDYFETGAARPDLVLMDLVYIFHPGLAPDHKPMFYRKLD